MSGDHGLRSSLPAAASAIAENPQLKLTLIGQTDAILRECRKRDINPDQFTIVDAPDVVAMDGEGRPVLWVDALCWAAAGGPTPVPDAAPSPGDAQASPWAGLDEATRHARLRQLVGDACQQVLQVTTLSWDRDLAEQGLDSIVALELRDRLRREGLELPLHRVVGGASPADLVVAAEEQLGPVVATVVTAEAVPVAAPSDASVAEPAIATSDGNDLLQAWWWTPFFLGALVGATLWALIG